MSTTPQRTPIRRTSPRAPLSRIFRRSQRDEQFVVRRSAARKRTAGSSGHLRGFALTILGIRGSPSDPLAAGATSLAGNPAQALVLNMDLHMEKIVVLRRSLRSRCRALKPSATIPANKSGAMPGAPWIWSEAIQDPRLFESIARRGGAARRAGAALSVRLRKLGLERAALSVFAVRRVLGDESPRPARVAGVRPCNWTGGDFIRYARRAFEACRKRCRLVQGQLSSAGLHR